MSSQGFIEVPLTLTSPTPPYTRTYTVHIQFPASSAIPLTYLRYVIAGAVETALLLPYYSVKVGTIDAWWNERYRFIDIWASVVRMPGRVTKGNVRDVVKYVRRGRGWLEAQATRLELVKNGRAERLAKKISVRARRVGGCTTGMLEAVHRNES